MPDPSNYSLDVQQPFQAALQGYQVGSAIQANQIQQAQQQAALAQQQQMRADLAQLSANPTPQGISAAVIKYPQLSEHFKRANDMLTTQQQDAQSKALLPIYFAAQSGNTDVAKQKLLDRAAALENSGMAGDAKEARDMASLIDLNPKGATVMLGGYLAHTLGPEKFIENFGKLGTEQRAADQAPGALRKVNADASAAESDATTKAVTADFAHQNAVADLEKKGWDVKNIQSEIGYRKEANRIAAMNAAAAQQTNVLRRQELELQVQKGSQDLADKVRAKQADVESATGTIDNLLNTVDRIKQNPSLNSVLGTIQGRMGAYVSDEASDAIALIDTLGSQAFLSQIPAMKGTGSLSEREGDKLQSALTNLSRTQSEGQFRANLDEVQRLMLKARKNVETRYGVKAGVPDTPAVQTAPEHIDALVSKYLNPKPPGAR
ncbi:MAG TPA: hypothetical protein VIN03_11955 [Roseateles sp.]